MAQPEMPTLETETAVESRRRRRLRVRHLPILAGALLPTGAIFWVHGENYAGNAAIY